MSFIFDTSNVVSTEFGVGRSDSSGRSLWEVNVDEEVRGSVLDMVVATEAIVDGSSGDAHVFNPAEKYGDVEYLYLPLEDRLSDVFIGMHEARNIDSEAGTLDDMESVFCYFARLRDGSGNRVTGIRRAAQFKGMLKKKTFTFSGSLRIIETPVFQLNNDFDVVVDAERIHIIHPKSFKILGEIEEALIQAISENLQLIGSSAPYVDWERVGHYAADHPRAAALLASIRSEGYAENLNPAKLVGLCERNGVRVTFSADRIEVEEDNVLGFLEVLDRRRYEVDVVDDALEHYKADSRKRVAG